MLRSKGASDIYLEDILPMRARGLTAAALGEPADSIEQRHPLLVGAARVALKPVLGLPVIRRRIQEARLDLSCTLLPSLRGSHLMDAV
jgi:hypothetical protein